MFRGNSAVCFPSAIAVLMLLFSSALQVKAAVYEDEVNLGLLIAANRDREAYIEMLNEFGKQNPQLKINYLATDDTGFRRQLDQWLDAELVDVTFSPAGNVLCRLARQGKIAALDQLWEANNWDSVFSNHVKNAVSCDGKIYGLPYGYYYWGVFYNKLIFKQFNLSIPETYEELLSINRTLSENGVVPFTLGSKNLWPTAAWFDYLNLRLNGLAFHHQLTAGKISFNDDKVRNVFVHWKRLIDQQTFIKNHRGLDWKQAMPFLYRGHAAMALSGAYLANQLPSEIEDNIGFFRFPRMNENMPFYENVPIETFVLNKLSSGNKAAVEMLKMAANNDTQVWLAKNLGYLSVYGDNKSYTTETAIAGIRTIKQAKGFSQYFDRNTRQDMIQPALSAFEQFMRDTDIEKAIEALEDSRLSVPE